MNRLLKMMIFLKLQKIIKKKNYYAISEEELREIFLYHLVRFVVVYGTGYGEKIK
jgi:hypothetical protein